MATFFGVILLIYGISSITQSFRTHDTMAEIINAGRDPRSLKTTLWSVRIIGTLSLIAAIYLLDL